MYWCRTWMDKAAAWRSSGFEGCLDGAWPLRTTRLPMVEMGLTYAR